jgi:hypothetical protein
MIFFKKKRIELGEGHIEQYTIFESKKLGGIWLYNWQTIEQNRFHTHAFSSYAFLLSGDYTEEVITETGKVETRVVNQWMKPRYLPKHYCHRILEARPKTWTIVFFSKWADHWYEYFDDTKTWVKYTWGRKVVKKIKNRSKKYINKIKNG